MVLLGGRALDSLYIHEARSTQSKAQLINLYYARSYVQLPLYPTSVPLSKYSHPFLSPLVFEPFRLFSRLTFYLPFLNRDKCVFFLILKLFFCFASFLVPVPLRMFGPIQYTSELPGLTLAPEKPVTFCPQTFSHSSCRFPYLYLFSKQ